MKGYKEMDIDLVRDEIAKANDMVRLSGLHYVMVAFIDVFGKTEVRRVYAEEFVEVRLIADEWAHRYQANDYRRLIYIDGVLD